MFDDMKTRPRRSFLLRGLAGVLVLGTGLGSGGDARAQARKSEPLELSTVKVEAKRDDPKARASFDEVAKAYKELTSYSDQGKFSVAMTVAGRPQKQEMALKLTLVRPNKLDFDSGIVRVTSDGKTLTTAIPQLKRYVTAPAPEKIGFDTFREGPLGAVLFGGASAPPMFVLLKLLTDAEPADAVAKLGGSLQLAAADPKAKPEADPKTGAGKPQAATIVVDFPDPQPDMVLTIDAATKLLAAIDLKISPELLARSGPAGQALTVEQFGWSSGAITTEVAKDHSFAYNPPQGFTKVESFANQQKEEAPRHDLLGHPAPEFTLTVLDGPAKTRTITKAELAGKVVVIDFWATWCGPCMRELPELQKVIENYAQSRKDVVIVALSEDKEPAELAAVRKLVEKTLADQKLSLDHGPVGLIGLDPSNSVGGAFQLEAYPTLVILDGKGIVQSVHVGFDPSAATPFNQSLAKEIDTLLAGKPLVAPANNAKDESKKDATAK